MVAAVAAVLRPHARASLPGERLEGVGCDARPGALDRLLGAPCVGAGLIADGLELGNAVLQHWVGEIGNAVLDGVVEPLGGIMGGELAFDLRDARQRRVPARLQFAGH